jgi:hypothetical protein
MEKNETNSPGAHTNSTIFITYLLPELGLVRMRASAAAVNTVVA